jgi:hypothetical protein
MDSGLARRRPSGADERPGMTENYFLYQRHQSVTCSAHWRVAMDVMISGCSLSLFQASQHASTMSS